MDTSFDQTRAILGPMLDTTLFTKKAGPTQSIF